jgi:Poly-beta-hydroxybutyrate polymerase N terminal
LNYSICAEVDNTMAAAQPGSLQDLALTESATAGAAPSVIPPDGPVQFAENQKDGRRSSQHDRDSYSMTALADITDRALRAATARFTAGVSPAAVAEAYLDWVTHLAYAPGKRIQLLAGR